MIIKALTIFPDMLENYMSESIMGRAREKGIVEFEAVDIRDFAENKHNQVDDYPYGGGAGMVMAAPPVMRAYRYAKEQMPVDTTTIYLTPRGKTFNQSLAENLAKKESLLFLCGRYEGIDERAVSMTNAMEVSIGDYVLTGGEIAAIAVIDAVLRLVPGTLSKQESHENDSFSTGLLEHPHYTRPFAFEGQAVPEVLLSGNHKAIEKWRREKSLEITHKKRPELLKEIELTKEDLAFLDSLK